MLNTLRLRMKIRLVWRTPGTRQAIFLNSAIPLT